MANAQVSDKPQIEINSDYADYNVIPAYASLDSKSTFEIYTWKEMWNSSSGGTVDIYDASPNKIKSINVPGNIVNVDILPFPDTHCYFTQHLFNDDDNYMQICFTA